MLEPKSCVMNTSTSDFIIEPIGVDTSDISDTEICESSTSSDAETFSESDEDELDTSFLCYLMKILLFHYCPKKCLPLIGILIHMINHCIQVLLAI